MLGIATIQHLFKLIGKKEISNVATCLIRPVGLSRLKQTGLDRFHIFKAIVMDPW